MAVSSLEHSTTDMVSYTWKQQITLQPEIFYHPSRLSFLYIYSLHRFVKSPVICLEKERPIRTEEEEKKKKKMVLLDKLWDDVVAGPHPERGLGKLRKITTQPINITKGY